MISIGFPSLSTRAALTETWRMENASLIPLDCHTASPTIAM